MLDNKSIKLNSECYGSLEKCTMNKCKMYFKDDTIDFSSLNNNDNFLKYNSKDCHFYKWQCILGSQPVLFKYKDIYFFF